MQQAVSQRNGSRQLRLFGVIRKAIVIKRLNRFVIECLLDGEELRAYLPNPGRLWELLLPGRTVYLVRNPSSSEAHLEYTAVAAEREGVPVMLHTHYTNAVARWLIEQGRIHGLEGYRIVRPEVSCGKSRFDFLLRKGRQGFVLEIKSCTLSGNEIAMFPDAVTERGRRHLEDLAQLSGRRDLKGGVLFVVHWPFARYFMPEYHTDLEFSRTLCRLRRALFIKAVAVRWREDLTLEDEVKELDIPWQFVEEEAKDRGNYILVLNLKEPRRIAIGGLGGRDFQRGYYLYVGSAVKDLSQRIERHKRTRKRPFWHIDYLREHADFTAALAVRGSVQVGCEIARSLKDIAEWEVAGFGSSDCPCESHLFAMRTNPITSPAFIGTLQYFRIDRLRIP